MNIEYFLDVLKPHHPSNDLLARTLSQLTGVTYVRVKVDEIDQRTTSIFITIRGTEEMSLEKITQTLEEYNCSLHSVDTVSIQKNEDKG
ncbi:MAG: hypothetical protein GF353_17480 [Candidatus Lokiarchaeota archaeon]|nr:hypothetical protein [Candidatus Lokiarchaeota archaeon]